MSGVLFANDLSGLAGNATLPGFIAIDGASASLRVEPAGTGSAPALAANGFGNNNSGYGSLYNVGGALGRQVARCNVWLPDPSSSFAGSIHPVAMANTSNRFYLALVICEETVPGNNVYKYGLLLSRYDGGNTTYIKSAPALVPPAGGGFVEIEFEANPNFPSAGTTTLNGRLWNRGSAYPSSPTATYADSASPLTSGYPGWRQGGGFGWLLASYPVITDGTVSSGVFDPVAAALSSPLASAASATTANASVSTNTASGTVYCLISTNSTETAAAIKSSGTAQAVSTTGAQAFTKSGLAPSTTYYAHFVQTAGGVDTAVANSASFATPALPAAVLSSPVGTATSTTTATATVSTDTGSGTLYFYASTNASETSANIKALGASQAVSAAGTQNVAFSGLTAGTGYYTHFVQVANGQDSNVANGSGFNTPSASAAVLSSPAASAVTATTATAGVSTNTGSGTLYCLASTNPTETVATIKAGGVSKTVTATGAQSFALTGLTQNTPYYLHFVQTVGGVDSGVSNSSSFTTSSATVTYTAQCQLVAAADGSKIPAANVAIHAFVHDLTTGALIGRKDGLTTNAAGLPPSFTASFGAPGGAGYDVKFVDDANPLRRSLERIIAS